MKLLRASRRGYIVIKFWRQIVRDADPGHDVTKSRRRERSRRFVSSLLSACTTTSWLTTFGTWVAWREAPWLSVCTSVPGKRQR